MGEEWRRGWHPERIRPAGSESKVLVVGAGPSGLEAALMLGRRGYEVMLAEASRELGGRVLGEARLPGLAAWIRVADYRVGQLERIANVEQARESAVSADDVLELGFEHVAVATGARWRADGVGRWHTRPVELGGVELLTPDDLIAGTRPSGRDVVVFDDDHYYLGGALAELLARDGFSVTLATPAARISEWTVNTMEQERIQRRLLEAGVTLEPGKALTAPGRLTCVYTDREHEVPCDALVLVTARLPVDSLAGELAARRSEWADAGLRSVQAIGDAFAPGTIATAVWDGRRYAEELDGVPAGDTVPFRREVVALAEAPVHTVRR
jgi:dimethylamine/trimethylamine dehydrogenase